jgi:hypothetical protein
MTLNGSNSRFSATGGGTLNITGTNSIGATTAPTGPALNVTGTTIGGSNVTFQRISATNGANGIILNNTGAGSFTVTGDGTLAVNGSGGAITSTTGDAIQLTNANDVTLRSMTLTGNGANPPLAADAAGTSGSHSIEVSGGSNLTLSGMRINGTLGTGLLMLNLGGTNRVNNNTRFENLLAGAGHAIYVNNTDTNNTLLEFDDIEMVNNAATHTNFFVANTGTSTMTVAVQNSLFEDLGTQALTVAGGGVATTSGTLTTSVLNNTFRNAKGLSENNLGVLVGNGASHTSTVQGNLFDNIAKDGTIANTSILRTQNNGGTLNATVTGNTIQNISYAAGNGGRHVIGHVYEPPAAGAGASNLVITNNTVSNVAYPGLGGNNREFIFVDYRVNANGGEITVQGNNVNMPTAGSQQAIELRFRQTNPNTVPVLVRGNTIAFNTAAAFLDVDAEDGATVQLTVDGSNNFTNSNAAPGNTIALATEDPAAAGGPPSMCANVTGNTLQAGAGVIDLNETAGTMTVTQASAAALAAANGIPAGNVTVGGTPTFGVAPCTVP